MVQDSLGRRPADGYEEQGAQAWLEGMGEDACPHPFETLASAEWRMGYAHEACLAVPCDPWDDEQLHFTDMELHARADRGCILSRTRWHMPGLANAEAAVGVSASEWPLRCHEIAVRLLGSGILSHLEAEHGVPRACYGIYEGEVAGSSPFAGRSACRHGWIEYPSGLVVDPTRWVFTANPPSVWCGSSQDYDLGARRLRARMGVRHRPGFDAAEPQFRLVSNSSAAADALGRALGDPALPVRLTLSRAQAFWVANAPPEVFGDDAKAIFEELVRMGLGGFIPADTRTELEATREQEQGAEPAAMAPAL